MLYAIINEDTLRAICSIIGDTNSGLTGSEIKTRLEKSNINDVSPGITKKDRLFNALIAKQEKDGYSNAILSFIKNVMAPERYVFDSENHESFRVKLNKALAFAGYEVLKSGDIHTRKPISYLDEIVNSPSGVITEKQKERSPYRIFISHSNKDVRYATFIKKYLQDNFNIDSFVAHEDIEPSKEWVEDILKALISNDCSIFIAIISQNYKESEWCNQEAGLAYGLGKSIFPVKLLLPDIEEQKNLTKNGFMSRYQLLVWEHYGKDGKKAEIIDSHNARVLLKAFYTRKIISFDQLIDSLEKSFGWYDAAEKLKLIIELNEVSQKIGLPLLNKSRIRKIIELSIQTSNVYNSYSAKRSINKIIEEYKQDIPEELVDLLRKKTQF